MPGDLGKFTAPTTGRNFGQGQSQLDFGSLLGDLGFGQYGNLFTGGMSGIAEQFGFDQAEFERYAPFFQQFDASRLMDASQGIEQDYSTQLGFLQDQFGTGQRDINRQRGFLGQEYGIGMSDIGAQRGFLEQEYGIGQQDIAKQRGFLGEQFALGSKSARQGEAQGRASIQEGLFGLSDLDTGGFAGGGARQRRSGNVLGQARRQAQGLAQERGAQLSALGLRQKEGLAGLDTREQMLGLGRERGLSGLDTREQMLGLGQERGLSSLLTQEEQLGQQRERGIFGLGQERTRQRGQLSGILGDYLQGIFGQAFDVFNLMGDNTGGDEDITDESRNNEYDTLYEERDEDYRPDPTPDKTLITPNPKPQWQSFGFQSEQEMNDFLGENSMTLDDIGRMGREEFDRLYSMWSDMRDQQTQPEVPDVVAPGVGEGFRFSGGSKVFGPGGRP